MDFYPEHLPLNVRGLIAAILLESPLHRNFISEALRNLSVAEIDELSAFLDYCKLQRLSTEYMADCYLTLVEDTIGEQIYFNAHKHYRYSSFAEVANKVYFDPEYMDKYMHGLAISSFLWANHIAISRYFRTTLPTNARGRYLEVGPGHGQFLLRAMRDCSCSEYLGVDISATSVAQTKNIINHFLPQCDAEVRLETRDFLSKDDLPADSFDIIVAGEVVEHVEQPEAFFCRIAELAKSDAHIFLTTCINTPAIDHIYLWRAPEELEKMIRACGLTIKDRLTLPYQGKTMAQAIAEDLSVNFAFVLGKA